MSVADQIRRHGFRRWYERQLVESHVYLVTAFLALILLLAGFESLDAFRRSPAYYALVAGIAAGAGILMFVCMRRFLVLLGRAETFAAGAACPQCEAWGKFEVEATEPVGPDDPPEAGRPHWLRVRCKRCGERWRLG